MKYAKIIPLLLVACAGTSPATAEYYDAIPAVDAAVVDSALPVSSDISFRYRDPVSPGAESVKCIDVPGPTTDTWVTGWHVERRSGAHHAGVAIRKTGAPYAVPTKCSLDPATVEGLLISTQPVLDFTLPGGAAIKIPANSSLIIETHELNSAPAEVEASIDFALHTTITPERIARLFVLVAGGTSVPPATTKTLTASCYTPRDLDVLAITSHSHAHSTLVTGTVERTQVYSSNTWAEPLVKTFDTPLHVPSGSSISWACTVANTTSQTLTQCQNRDTCEMCELIGWAVTSENWTCYK